jgi:hypothetical protein
MKAPQSLAKALLARWLVCYGHAGAKVRVTQDQCLLSSSETSAIGDVCHSDLESPCGSKRQYKAGALKLHVAASAADLLSSPATIRFLPYFPSRALLQQRTALFDASDSFAISLLSYIVIFTHILYSLKTTIHTLASTYMFRRLVMDDRTLFIGTCKLLMSRSGTSWEIHRKASRCSRRSTRCRCHTMTTPSYSHRQSLCPARHILRCHVPPSSSSVTLRGDRTLSSPASQ